MHSEHLRPNARRGALRAAQVTIWPAAVRALMPLNPERRTPWRQDPRVVVGALMKLAGGCRAFAGELNVDAFLELDR